MKYIDIFLNSLPISSMTTIECMNAIAIFLLSALGIQMENICHSNPKAAVCLSFSLRLKYAWLMCEKASDYNRKTHQHYRAQSNIARDCQSAEQVAEVLSGYSTKTMPRWMPVI